MENIYTYTDLNKTYKDITFVTMLFNITDSQEKHEILSTDGNAHHLKRVYKDYYIDSLEKLCSKFENIVVFCDKECADNLDTPNAKVMITSIDELPYYQQFCKLKDLFSQLPNRVFYKKNINADIEGTESNFHDRALYASVVLSKQHIMSKAAELISTEYLCWLDAGLFAKDHLYLWDGWDGNITATPEDSKIRIICSRNPILKQTLQDIRATTLKDAVFCRRPFTISFRWLCALFGREIGPVPQVSGAYQLMKKTECVRFEQLYNEYVQRIMDRNLICYEQGVLTLMLKENPDLFDVVYSGRNMITAGFNGVSNEN